MNLNDLSFDEVKALAESVEGFEFDKRLGESKLKESLAAYLTANPEKVPAVTDLPAVTPPGVTPIVGGPDDIIDPEPPVIPGDGDTPDVPGDDDEDTLINGPPDDDEDENPDKNDEDNGLVKIKSAYRGKIASSKGTVDFGDNGIAEVSKEIADHFCKIEGYEKC